MIGLGQLLRLLHINQVLIRHGLDDIVLATHLFRPVRFVRFLLPWQWFHTHDESTRAVRIRQALEELGPIFVKFGQILSTRRDLMPADIADELARLQDHVPPFPGEVARAIVEKAYGKPVDQVFLSFDEQPLASASIAQVHVARLPDGRDVIVKVVRPGIEKIIRRDVGLLYIIAELAERYSADARRLRPLDVVQEYEKTIIDELDLQREAASASQLRRNFAESGLLYVPEVYWPGCRANVMVMERISGIPVSDIDALRAAGVDLKQLSERGVEIFFTQVFSHNFFHADMHPGNIFVSSEGQYIAVDFGIMGSLSQADKRYLAENFLAFFQRDYRRVAELHVNAGWVPSSTRVEEFEAAIRTVCEPIFERPLSEISFGRLLIRLFQTARRFNMEVQPQLVLLQKTLLNIEGLGRQLYPDLDLWTTAKPFLERWMKSQMGWENTVNSLRKNLPLWGEKLPELPVLVYEALQRQRLGVGENRQQQALDQLRSQMAHGQRRTLLAVTGAALTISAALLMLVAPDRLAMAGPIPWASWLLGSIGLLSLVLAMKGQGE